MEKNKNSLFAELEWRGLLKDVINPDNIQTLIDNKKAFYIGIDPTGPNLHLGHYATTLVVSKILNTFGLKPVFVIGGFTATIGDPSGKDSERQVMSLDAIAKNAQSLSKQLTDLANKLHITDFKIVNNIDFYKDISIIEYYQTYGKMFNVNHMISKEMVKNRLETGISYTEFSYQIFQGIDFLKLFEKHNVGLQLGGSDQWGNIVSGVDLIRKVHAKETSGLTTNLVVDKNGKKIGKTESGATVWMDKHVIDSYTVFQFFLNLEDELALELVKKLTLISKHDYGTIEVDHKTHPQKRVAQHYLANYFISLVFDSNEYNKAKSISEKLFNEDYQNLSNEEFTQVEKNMPNVIHFTKGSTLVDLLIESKNIQSKREYREFIANKAIKINGEAVLEETKAINENDLFFHKYAVVSVGKKKKALLISK